MKIKETRHLFWTDLRYYCIRKGYYTLGTEEEFEALYNMLPRTQYQDGLRDSQHVTTEDLQRIAEDIMAHSDPEKFNIMDLPTLMYDINEECCKTGFEQVEE